MVRTDAADFSPEDLATLGARGISLEEATRQVALLRNPPPPVVLDRPCTVGDGIIRLDTSLHDALLERGDAVAAQGRVTKFVPASGAATRMFKDLIAALEGDRRPSSSPAGRELFQRLDDFPFAEELRRTARVTGPVTTEEGERAVLRTLLHLMRYAELPKALIPFHRADRPRTAFEEHLLEGTRYVRALDGSSRMHFTVAPEFRTAFERLLDDLRASIEARRHGAVLQVGFSEQDPATDTIALDEHGRPFRKNDGTLLFRPAGHGALLRNLQSLGGDLVVLKNIDNILPDETCSQAVHWKRLLIGCLARLQDEVFAHLRACEPDESPEDALAAALEFIRQRFARVPPAGAGGREATRAFVRHVLNRPLRVCGVVKNEGEPGGAPFWVRGADGSVTVQIVEPSQVHMQDAAQAQVFRSSTHFNPVDIVAALRSSTGDPFDLDAYVDPATAFLSSKSYEGRSLTALERPGLWNGAMAGWNTVCVEVPSATFAPVKTVFDLLRPQHQLRGAQAHAAEQLHGRILVVDDQRLNQRILQEILTSAGFEVVIASDGHRALDAVLGGGIDLVLLDIVLPGLDGYEVIGRLREMPEARDVPAIFISSLSSVADKVKGLELGAADYVTKPFNKHEILARVRAQLRIRRLTDSLARANAQLTSRQEVILEDLRAAADIQKALLPQELEFPPLAGAAVFQPSMEVGGDIFNVVRLDDRTVAVFVADVSGHGVASALLTVSLTQRLSRAGLLADLRSPAEILSRLEREYPFERFEKYFSIVVLVCDVTTGTFRYASAGHPSPFIVGRDGRVRELEVGGPIIGMGFDLPFEEGVDTLGGGERLVLYTDGVTEDVDDAGERFGVPRLHEHFVSRAGEPLRHACATLLPLLAERRGDTPPADDIALIAFECR